MLITAPASRPLDVLSLLLLLLYTEKGNGIGSQGGSQEARVEIQDKTGENSLY